MKVELPNKKYEIIYADPPWQYDIGTQHTGKGGKTSGGSATHYLTAKTSEMEKWDIKSIAEKNSILFMWTSSPHLEEAIELGKAWGFEYKTIAFIWDKQRVNPGYYTMSQCEIVLLFKRGKIPQPRGSRNIRQFVSSLREKHSKKPDEVRDRITKMFPTQTKIELFARSVYDGWDAWGNEVDKNEEVDKNKINLFF